MASDGDLRDSLYDCEPKLTLGHSESQICSFCKKCFPSLQSLGGHQTVHREEIKQLRNEHERYMDERRKRARVESKRRPRSAAPAAVTGDRERRVPAEIDFVGKFDSVDRRSSEGTAEEVVTSSEKLKLELSL